MGFLRASRTGPAILSTFSVTSAYSAAPVVRTNHDLGAVNTTPLTAHDDDIGRELRILRSLCERLNDSFRSFLFRKSAAEEKTRRLTCQIPPFLLDGIRIAFCDEGPHELGNGHVRVKLKVERDLVFGRVEEVDESPAELEAELEEIVARSEREDGVQGGDGASARRECEEIAVAVRG